MKIIHTNKAPAAIASYSQAVEIAGIVYTSGQIAINPEQGKIVARDIAGQAEQCCENIGAILIKAGMNFENVVKTTCFLKNISDFETFNTVYGKYFISKPARSCVVVKDLPAGALCEIEAIAGKK